MAKLESKKQKTDTRIEKMQSVMTAPETVKFSTAEEKLLTLLLATQPELRAKLLEALETDQFFITISFCREKTPEDPNDLKHFYCRHNYAGNDVLPSIRHIIGDYTAKEMPTAEIEDRNWH